MVERRKKTEPDFFQIAIDKLKLNEEEKQLLFEYRLALFHKAFDFISNPNNEDKEFPSTEIKKYADEKVPGGWEIAVRVLKKEDALKRIDYIINSDYSLDA